MFVTIGTFLFGLIGKKAAAGPAKALGIGALVAVLVLSLGLAKCAYDRSIIGAHDAKRDAATAKADRKADAKAAEERRTDDARITNETQALENVEAHYANDTPTARRVARQRCIRLQQQARDAGRQPPACT